MKLWLYILVLLMVTAAPALAVKLPIFEGLVEPRELVSFSSQVPGILSEVNVERGDKVKRGDILAHLKSGVEKAAVHVAEARVEFGKRKALRNEELYKKKLISVHEKDELETEIHLAELQLAEVREQLALRTIKSTIDGVVVERLGAPGEYVGEHPFLKIAQIDPLNVEIVVPFVHFGAIKEGMKATVHLGEPVAKQYVAKVVVVDMVIDAASGTFRVRLELANPQLNLPSGMRCQVEF